MLSPTPTLHVLFPLPETLMPFPPLYLLNVFSWVNSQLIVNYLEKPSVTTRLSILNPVGSQRAYSLPHHWQNGCSPSWDKISCRVGVMYCNTCICLNQWPICHLIFSTTTTIKHMGPKLQKYGWYFFFGAGGNRGGGRGWWHFLMIHLLVLIPYSEFQ